MAVNSGIIKEILEVKKAFEEDGAEATDSLVLSYYLRLLLTRPCYEWEDLKKWVDNEEAWGTGLLYKEYVSYCVKLREKMLALDEGPNSQKV
jgi:hypothetical protein